MILEIKEFAKNNNSRIIGPNTPGMITVGEAMVGFVPYWLKTVYKPGNIGLVSRSGSLTNVISSKLNENNLKVKSLHV